MFGPGVSTMARAIKANAARLVDVGMTQVPGYCTDYSIEFNVGSI
jgi:hypothetical protein